MKLIRLKLNSSFRSLHEGFEVIFREKEAQTYNKLNEFHPYCLAGLNASGKSNVLEVLSLIFFYLECSFSKYLPNDFKVEFDKKQIPFLFELEYFIQLDSEPDLVHIFVKKTSSSHLEFSRVLKDGTLESINTIPTREGIGKSNATAKLFLPEIVVGYSSGENEILSLPFHKTRLIHFDNYQQALLNEEQYNSKPLTSLVYIDYSMSQAVLLSIFMMEKELEVEQDQILHPIRDELKIEKIHSFRLVIRDALVEGKTNKNKSRSILSQLKVEKGKSIIEKLEACSTCSYRSDNRELILDYFINNETKRAFEYYFKSSNDLFQAFQTLLELNLHSFDNELKKEIYTSDSMYISEKMPKTEGKDLIFYFNNFFITKKGLKKPLLLKSLSDGEHQFLHTMGICLMLKDRTALLLLDEPETHFNPDWRSKFISILKDSLERSGGNNLQREVVITSHSPFIISDCFPDKVIVFKNKKQPINARQMKFNTFGTSVNIVLEEIFKKEESIPNYSLSKLKEIQNRDFKTLEDIEKAKEDSRLLGDSPEKVFLFRDLLLKEEELKKY